jgi:hypothetical protein
MMFVAAQTHHVSAVLRSQFLWYELEHLATMVPFN